MFDWELSDSDQRIFDTKMMVLLVQGGLTPMMRKKVLNDIQQGLTSDYGTKRKLSLLE